ncbi:uncharacterized protein LOC143029111 [Oratosquilla oratoria]|uniref:uncharacterized protein LOC143029111 n=1 Tax=Oratosquilla oratoria TaxID=337810 RepID=UPI003F76E770
MSKNDALRSGATGSGFQRWIRLSIDDLPLIRPPTHHMLAHVTGGLKALYEELYKHKDDVKSEEKASDKTKEGTKGKEKGSAGDSKNKESEKVSNKDKGQTDEKSESSDKKKKEKENREEKKKEDEDEDTESPKKSDASEDEKNDTEDGEKVDHGGGEEGGGGKEDKKEEEDEKDKSDLNSSDKINEDDGSDVEKEDMETTPYTDEEGEFAPEPDMPLLASRYKHIQVLARGQSAIIIKALDTFHSDKPVGIKVLHRVYKPIGSQEADILLELHRADPWLYVPFARLLNQFLYGPHYCLVFEYLSPTPLYNHYELRNIRGKTSIPHVRQLTVKLLTVLGFLYKQNVIHADLKPENILLRDEDDLSSIMVVDFGNALRNTDEELSLYYTDFELQTLLYRAPEVLFGMKFSLEVDMWSLGCLVAECYLGEPLFMGKTKKDVLKKIVDLLGPFPKEFQDGEYAEEFAAFIGRPMSRYQRVENLRKKLKDCKDISFLMFVEKLLTYLPDRRFTPFESACHPFLATIAPFLYLTPSPGYIRYPTVVVDMSMYPYLPGLPDDDDEDTASADGRRRLAQFSHPMSNANRPLPTGQRQIQPNRKGPHSFGPNMGVTIQGAGNQGRGAGPKSSRPDVQETLKSMGLRCEDFTISVYSREQAHALLRKQGVEVTNHSQAKEKSSHGGKELPKSGKLSTNKASRGTKEDEDDDDCVILDPPDVPKTTGPLPSKLPSQFRLMGTTVQVNRGAKRPSRPAVNQPSAKRSNAYLHAHAHAYHFFDDEDDEDFSDEMDEEVANARADATVQDTLKRLKNYNISITCRGNTGNRDQRIETLDHSSGAEDNHYNESDDDMMANFLECELNEDDEIGDDEEAEILRDPRRLMASKRERLALLQNKSKLSEKEDTNSSSKKRGESKDDANSSKEKEDSGEGKEEEGSDKEKEEEMAEEENKETQEEEKDSSQSEKDGKDQPKCESENVNGKERLETSEDQEETKEEDKLDSSKDEELPEGNLLEGNEDEDITEEDELALLKEEVNKLEGKEGGSEWMESLDWDPAKMLEQDEDLESEIV